MNGISACRSARARVVEYDLVARGAPLALFKNGGLGQQRLAVTAIELILIVLAQALCALRVIKCGVALLGVLHTKVLVVVPRWNGVKRVGGIHGAVFCVERRQAPGRRGEW